MGQIKQQWMNNMASIDANNVTIQQQIDELGPGANVTEVVTLLVNRIEKLEEKVKHLEANRILLEEDYGQHEEVSDLQSG